MINCPFIITNGTDGQNYDRPFLNCWVPLVQSGSACVTSDFTKAHNSSERLYAKTYFKTKPNDNIELGHLIKWTDELAVKPQMEVLMLYNELSIYNFKMVCHCNFVFTT